jgi:hypothetical protein
VLFLKLDFKMTHLVRNILLVLLIIFTFSGCNDDGPDVVVVVPTDLEVIVDVSESGNGVVNVTATATNARTYEFIFGEEGKESIQNTSGEVSYIYSQSGSYDIEIKAYGNGTEFISQVIEITVSVIRDITKPPTDGYISPESYDGFTLVWSDEFNGTSLSLDNWTHEIGTGSNGWGNNELQFYRSNNTTVSDGSLTIEARKESFSGSNYTSSRIITQNKQEFKYGRIDIRAALPYGKGVWPALWMLGANFHQVGWPRCGEIAHVEIPILIIH